MRLLLVSLLLLSSSTAFAKQPRLTLFVSVDGMGTELFARMRPQFRHGFAQLSNGGAYFPHLRHGYVKTSTGPGHATLATGANPWRHGIAANRRINRAAGKLEAVLGDPAHPVLEAPPSEGDVSPQNLLVETLADRLRLSTHGKAKVVSMSTKARAAISLAGRLGQAWWWNDRVGKFVSGTFYVKEFPRWLTDFNGRNLPDGYYGREWQLLLSATAYAGEDDRAAEGDILALGRTFPHVITGGLAAPGVQFYSALARSPFMDEVMVELAKAAIAGEQLGKDEVPDLLAVGFSTIDRLGHLYGPSSWEVQDAMLRLDRTLGDLISAAERAAGGRSNLLIVLTADHGMASLPEEWAAAGLPAARLDPAELKKALGKALMDRYGIDPVIEVDEDGVDVYLDHQVIGKRGLEPSTVSRYAARWLSQQPQIAVAVARDDLGRPGVAGGYLDALRRGFHPDVSGDVLFVTKAFQVVNAYPSGTNHGSPHAYDAMVPLLIAGRGIRAGVYAQPVDATDVAPTVALLWEMLPPAQAEGQARTEMLGPPRGGQVAPAVYRP